MSSQNHGEKAGEGVKGVFKSINDVGESLRGNINGALDGFGNAITGNNSSHAHGNTGTTGLGHNTGSTGLGHNNGSSGLGHSTTGSSGLGHSMGGNSGLGHSTGSTTTTGVQNDSEKVRRDLNQGLDDAGRKVDGFFHHHK